MSRPGTRLTRKDILLQTKLAELEKGDICDKQGNALLAVLDMESEMGDNNKNESAGLPRTKQPSKYAAWLHSDKWNFPYNVMCKSSKYKYKHLKNV